MQTNAGSWSQNCLGETMRKLYLDFETYYDVRFSLTKMTTAQYVNDENFSVWGVGLKFDEDDTQWIPGDECFEVLQSIDWSDTAVVCHNTLFDAYILTHHYGVVPKYYYDTAAMSRGVYPNQSASLKEVAMRVFPNDVTKRKGDELVTAKGIKDLPPDIEEDIAGYCIQDVDLTYDIFNAFLPTYPKQELDLIDLTCRMFVEPKIILNKKLLEEHRNNVKETTSNLIEASGLTREVLASQVKFTQHLTDELQLVIPKKKSGRTGKMIPALGKSDPGYIQMCRAHPEHQAIWDAREAVKSRIEETRATRFLDSVNPDGTISVPLRYYAAHTGRFGGAEKMNLQNLPRGSKLRTALQSPAGQLMYVADLSNIEARMLAWLAKEQDLIDAFATGRDVYCEFASQIYNRDITKDDKLERYVGKTAILGLGYGMGADKFKATLKSGSPSVEVTDATALNIVSQYRAMYPNIPLLWAGCKNLLFAMMNRGSIGMDYGPLTVDTNALQLPNEMHLKYPQLQYQHGEFTYSSGRSYIRTHGPRVTENIVQALARIVITDQMLEIQRIPEVSVVLQIHDEVISLASDYEPDKTLEKIIDIMKTPLSWCPDLPLDAEGGYSTSYDK